MKKIQFYLIILLILHSCSNKENSKEIKITPPPGYYSHAENWDIIEWPADMALKDSILIILNNDYEKIFHVYNTNNLKLLGSFGIQGKGPNEFHTVACFDQFDNTQNGQFLWVLDLNNRKFKLIDIQKSLTIKSTVIVKDFFQTHSTVSEQFAFVVNDSLVIGSSSGNINGLFFKYNLKDDNLTWEDKISFAEIESPEIKGYVYKNCAAINPESNKIAVAMAFFKKILIIDVEGNLEKIISISENKEKIFFDKDMMWIQKVTRSYIDIFVTSDKIYALYLGIKEKDIRTNNKSSEIHVFDWSGNPFCIITLDKPIDKIIVDEKNKFILGAQYQFGNSIYKFRMN